jgi:hypothetical protein
MFLSCGSFVVITTFSTGLIGVEVTEVTEVTSRDRSNFNSHKTN